MVAIGFLASFALPGSVATGFVRAALEAGLVGGLADWFAVVALFRYPLGVPIPHTAVIPRSKEGLGGNLSSFVRENFLGTDQVQERLADPRHVERLGIWLADPDNADRLAGQVAVAGAAVLDTVDDDRVVERLLTLVRERLGEIPVARLAGESLDEAVRAHRHDALVTAAITGLRGTIAANRGALRRRLGDQSPAWVPPAVDDLVFDRAERVVQVFLTRVAEDTDHELRHALDEQLLAFAERLRRDPAMAGRTEDLVDQAVSEELLRRWIDRWWTELGERVRAAADPAASAPTLRRLVTTVLVELGEHLRDDPELHDRVVAALAALAPQVAATGQKEVGALIAGTIDRWDVEDTSRRLERWLGPDLQFVRVNGTVVGALVGVGLHLVTRVLG